MGSDPLSPIRLWISMPGTVRLSVERGFRMLPEKLTSGPKMQPHSKKTQLQVSEYLLRLMKKG